MSKTNLLSELLSEAKKKIDLLSFDECVTLFNSVEKGSPMIDLIFDRMELLDSNRFVQFLDN
jgi:hypothetical protein